MARTQSKTGLIVTIVVLVVTLLVVGSITYAMNANKSTSTTETTPEKTPEVTKDASSTETDDAPAEPSAETTPAKVDPASLTSIAIEPLGISVAYTKGTPGFDFAVKKTASKTQYVEFTSSDLIGTKCTNDEGSIASIIKNPSSNENQATISQTVKVGSDSYGLSLAGKGCTSDAELLDEYQAAFTNGFQSLTAL